MQCIKCGSEIGESLGLCFSCRASGRTLSRDSLSSNHNSVSPWYFQLPVVLFFSTLIISIAVFVSYQVSYNAQPVYERGAGKLEIATVGNRDNSLVYNTSENIRYEGILFDSASQAGGPDKLGIELIIGMLSSDKYNEYTQHIIRSGQCPASFLNGNVQKLGIVPADSKIADSLKQFDYKRGQKITVVGVSLTSPSMRYGDSMISMSVNLSGINLITPTAIYIDGNQI